MKIYPSNHIIENNDSVDIYEDIVLGYFDTEYLTNIVKININEEYDKNSTEAVLPFDNFKTLDISLFDSDDNVLSGTSISDVLKRQSDGKYLYTPKATMTFSPTTFNYTVIAKKNIEYSSSRKYNIKVNCLDNSLAEILMYYFADSYNRDICPTNIRFNNGDRKIESLYNNGLDKCDFVFIKSRDGKHILNEDGTNGELIDLNKYIDKNIVPWIICDKYPDSKDVISLTDEIDFDLSKNVVNNTKTFTTTKYLSKPIYKMDEMPHDLFDIPLREMSPIVIKEFINKSFVVYCHTDFMDRLRETYPIFYEVLMYVYCNSYVSTDPSNEWITDIMPDYITQNGRLTQKEKFTSNMELHKILGFRQGEVDPVEVKISSEKVYYTGLSSNYLVFKKLMNSSDADPIKQDDQISIYTSRNTVMFYDKFIYIVEESISDKITYSVSNDILSVRVKPFKNTYLNTSSFKYDKVISAAISKTEDIQNFSLVWDMSLKEIELTDSPDDNDIILATIQVFKSREESKFLDMRRRGGGLSDGHEDVYECLDIGHTLGRPYRKGGALIADISLPYKYKDKHEKIYKIIYDILSKHMVADDFLVLNIEYDITR